ncbi:hypothetical protein [Pollutimonas bauzanensis]|uniref:hypothetical protein n=1 Tax=Pollutimonas bauzanensis TaxID=658167 RepID=UPI000934886D
MQQLQPYGGSALDAGDFHIAWSEVDQFLGVVKSLCKVVPLTVEIHDLARRFAERHGLIIEESLTLRNPCA